MLDAESELAHPGIEKLTHEHPELAMTLRVWCESQGKIAHAARELGVHENTVRFRVQKAADIASPNLGDPDTVLTAWLQLRASDRVSDANTPEPSPRLGP
jgi:DNA-binding PucR family transcriptional regulator